MDIGFINFNPYSTFERLHKNVDFLEETVFASVLYYLVERCGITKFSKIYDRVNADGLLLQSTDTGCYSYRYTHEEIGKLSDFLYYRYHENEGSKMCIRDRVSTLFCWSKVFTKSDLPSFPKTE